MAVFQSDFNGGSDSKGKVLRIRKQSVAVLHTALDFDVLDGASDTPEYIIFVFLVVLEVDVEGVALSVKVSIEILPRGRAVVEREIAEELHIEVVWNEGVAIRIVFVYFIFVKYRAVLVMVERSAILGILFPVGHRIDFNEDGVSAYCLLCRCRQA